LNELTSLVVNSLSKVSLSTILVAGLLIFNPNLPNKLFSKLLATDFSTTFLVVDLISYKVLT
jgi:hypothetical protein